MGLMTSAQYLETIKARKPMDIWFLGEKITNPLEANVLKPSLATITKLYDLQFHPKLKSLLVVHSDLINEDVNFYLNYLTSREVAIQKTRLARAMAEILGCCTFRCTGSEAISALYPLTYDMDKETGTHYHERFKTWLKDVQKKDLCVSAALTDPKGDRSRKPYEQKDPDMHLHVVEKRDDGIVIRGAKVNQTGTIFANEMMVVPTYTFPAEGKQYVVSCAVPTDTKGITYILGRTPGDKRIGVDELEDIDFGKKYADHQATIIFDNVFVPIERVFLCEEWKYINRLMEYFTSIHRLTAGGCKSGGLSMLLGAGAIAAEHIGVQREGHIKNKLADIGMAAETLYALSLAAGYEGFSHPSGAWIPNSLLAHTSKYRATWFPFDCIRSVREITSGWGDTAPSAKDLMNPEIGPKLAKYYMPAKEGATPEDRLRIVRLIENLGRGSNWTAMALHGGGNPEAARLMALRHMDWKKLIAIAEVAAGIRKDDKQVLDMIAERDGKIDCGPKAFGI